MGLSIELLECPHSMAAGRCSQSIIRTEALMDLVLEFNHSVISSVSSGLTGLPYLTCKGFHKGRIARR